MNQPMPFRDVVEAADMLSLDEQETLLQILTRRVAEQGRERIVAAVEESRREFEAGGCRPATAEELMREIDL